MCALVWVPGFRPKLVVKKESVTDIESNEGTGDRHPLTRDKLVVQREDVKHKMPQQGSITQIEQITNLHITNDLSIYFVCTIDILEHIIYIPELCGFVEAHHSCCWVGSWI